MTSSLLLCPRHQVDDVDGEKVGGVLGVVLRAQSDIDMFIL